jgi:putative two-component system response regulator
MSNFREEKAVARLAEIVALECGTSPAAARQVRTAASLHDIGKLKIPGSIINKPGKLTAREFEVIKTHTVLGAEMLGSFQGKLGEMARVTAMYHHEWYDGSQSYWGKRAAVLPFYVQIAAICDVFTALLYRRPYKRPWPPEEALAYIQNKAGTQFSPALTDIFLPLARNDDRVWAIFKGGDDHTGRIQ